MKRKLTLYIFLWISFIATTSAEEGPSFKCSNSNTDTEIAICSSSKLSRYDLRLALLYQEFLSSLEDEKKSPAIISQRKWVKNRDLECKAKTYCLKQLYETQIRYYEVRRPSDVSKIVATYDNYRLDDHRALFFENKLIFSGYNSGGNNFDITELDPVSGDENIILKDLHGAQFLAKNNKYIIAREDGKMTDPLIVFDRETGKELGSKGLNHYISHAYIEDSELFIIQGSRFGHGSNATAILMTLPNLKIVKKYQISAGNGFSKWGSYNIGLGKNITLYNKDYNVVRMTDKLPSGHPSKNINCSASELSIHNNMVFVVAGCGMIQQYELPSLNHVRDYPRISVHAQIALEDNLLFVSPEKQGGEPVNIHVYDTNNGKLLRVLPIHGGNIFVKGDKLISVKRRFAKKGFITVYEYNI